MKDKQIILVVDDQEINRQILRHILDSDYEVIEAVNGRDALRVLDKTRDISAVILDIVMPEMDGYDFLTALKGTTYVSLPIVAVTATKDEAAEQKALDLGAWDFISKPYNASVLQVRLKNVIVRSQFYLINEMKHAYEHDSLTDLYNRTGFFTETQKMLDRLPNERFALMRFDIDGFHLLNTFWGEEEGNRFLRYVGDGIRQLAKLAEPCTFGRINADTFGLCMRYNHAFIEKYLQKACTLLAAYNTNYRIKPSLGVYVIERRDEKIETMYEWATLAARECKDRFETYLCYYKPEMSQKIAVEQTIVAEMQQALDTEQFEVYLQPKYNLETEQPYGAEALIRWRHPEKGMLSPGLFIPIFERNGFVGKIDQFVWEKVCRTLRRWLDEGKDPAPISVNVSRVNMYNPNLVRLLTGLVQKYNIDPRLLNLELTESAYMDDPDQMESTVHALQEAGFVIMMDDFGSGYSSLNTLKDIPVNVLKIDMKFLADGAPNGRNECILAAVIRMAGWLKIPVIMEGVETARQVDFLKSIGCGYVQGYYYAKPMPIPSYEELTDRINPKPIHSHSDNHEAIFNTIWTSSEEIDLLFNSIQQPAAIYEYESGVFRALRVNTIFNSFFGYGRPSSDYSDLSHLGISQKDLARIKRAFDAASDTKQRVCCVFTLLHTGQLPFSMSVQLQYWGANEKSTILFATFPVVDNLPLEDRKSDIRNTEAR